MDVGRNIEVGQCGPGLVVLENLFCRWITCYAVESSRPLQHMRVPDNGAPGSARGVCELPMNVYGGHAGRLREHSAELACFDLNYCGNKGVHFA